MNSINCGGSMRATPLGRRRRAPNAAAASTPLPLPPAAAAARKFVPTAAAVPRGTCEPLTNHQRQQQHCIAAWAHQQPSCTCGSGRRRACCWRRPRRGSETRANASAADPPPSPPQQPPITTAAEAEARYPVLLAILLRLAAAAAADDGNDAAAAKFDAFVGGQPLATSVPFLSWAADAEARAPAPQRAALGALLERLVRAREAAEAASMDVLYEETLALIADAAGADDPEAAKRALVAADPRRYASALATALTGADPADASGYGPAYDALLKVAPPATLTPKGVARAHKEAAGLAEDLRVRRRRSFAAALGRVRISTPEQEAALLAPSAAARILDLLLGLPTSDERAALLPDCFTPPPPEGEQPQPADPDADTDELWCTPAQLLTEVDARLRAAERAASSSASAAAALGDGGGDGGSAGSSSAAASMPSAMPQELPLLGGGHGLVGEAYVGALRELRAAVASRWLAAAPGGRGDERQQ